MLHNKRAEHQCCYGCCRSLRRTKSTTWAGLLRRREKRQWKSEIW